jgi:drug/metabolite transporter superfamily protein YnfA
MQRLVALSAIVAAAIFEVGGDALIRSGLRARAWLLIVFGSVMLGAYGVVLNLLPLDFSRVLGSYVAVFVFAAALYGRVVFHEDIPLSTWLGIAVMLVGSAVVLYGSAR